MSARDMERLKQVAWREEEEVLLEEGQDIPEEMDALEGLEQLLNKEKLSVLRHPQERKAQDKGRKKPRGRKLGHGIKKSRK